MAFPAYYKAKAEELARGVGLFPKKVLFNRLLSIRPSVAVLHLATDLIEYFIQYVFGFFLYHVRYLFISFF